MNIFLEYLYRDGGNNKVWGNAVFSNRLHIEPTVLHEKIKSSLIDGEFFIAEDVFLPSLRFDAHDDDLDHDWHEYYSIKEMASLSDDGLSGDIYDFINRLIFSKARNCC